MLLSNSQNLILTFSLITRIKLYPKLIIYILVVNIIEIIVMPNCNSIILRNIDSNSFNHRIIKHCAKMECDIQTRRMYSSASVSTIILLESRVEADP